MDKTNRGLTIVSAMGLICGSFYELNVPLSAPFNNNNQTTAMQIYMVFLICHLCVTRMCNILFKLKY